MCGSCSIVGWRTVVVDDGCMSSFVVGDVWADLFRSMVGFDENLGMYAGLGVVVVVSDIASAAFVVDRC